ncbi:MAG TPA: hypothetical protein GX708_15920 [Gallicola sp.]|nr:hypothetical protein [Gallicola sp.]
MLAYYEAYTNSCKDKTIIINFGKRESPLINKSNFECINIIFNKWTFLKQLFKALSLTNKYNIKNIISFDSHAYLIARILGLLNNKIKVTNILCGGPNPKKYYPYSTKQILITKENFDYFFLKRKMKNPRIFYIPNRIYSLHQNKILIEEIKSKYNLENKKVFLKISRLCSYYKNSIFQAINFVDAINSQNYILVLIGNVEDKKLYEEISNNKNVVIIDERNITSQANKIIDICDFYIGTGRGIMEAASLGKILFVPNKASKYPLLLDENNFEVAFNYNFSERIDIDINDKEYIQNINNILQDQVQTEKLVKLSLNKFYQYFNIMNVINDLIEIINKNNYEGSITYRLKYIYDLINHFLRTLKASLID